MRSTNARAIFERRGVIAKCVICGGSFMSKSINNKTCKNYECQFVRTQEYRFKIGKRRSLPNKLKQRRDFKLRTRKCKCCKCNFKFAPSPYQSIEYCEECHSNLLSESHRKTSLKISRMNRSVAETDAMLDLIILKGGAK